MIIAVQNKTASRITVCPRRRVHFYIASRFTTMDKTSWTTSMYLLSLYLSHCHGLSLIIYSYRLSLSLLSCYLFIESASPMVLVLDGNSDIGEHVWTEIGNLRYFRHSFRSTAFSLKDYFSFTRAPCVLSHPLI